MLLMAVEKAWLISDDTSHGVGEKLLYFYGAEWQCWLDLAMSTLYNMLTIAMIMS